MKHVNAGDPGANSGASDPHGPSLDVDPEIHSVLKKNSAHVDLSDLDARIQSSFRQRFNQAQVVPGDFTSKPHKPIPSTRYQYFIYLAATILLASLIGAIVYWQLQKTQIPQTTQQQDAPPKPAPETGTPQPEVGTLPPPKQQDETSPEKAPVNPRPKNGPMRQPYANPPSTLERGQLAGLQLSKIKTLFIFPLGNDEWSSTFRNALATDLTSSDRLAITEKIDEGDAALRVTEKEQSTLLLINEEGKILWQQTFDRKRDSKAVAAQLAQSLLAEIKKAETNK